MPQLPLHALRRLWRRLWGMLPASALPFRLRLSGLMRRGLRLAPWLARDILHDPDDPVTYRAWLARHHPPPDRAAIAAHIAALPARPLISVVMPVYNAPAAHLREAIESVRAQLYPHWELCIADDASPAPHVARLLAEAAAGDARIRWVRRERNGHISAATNTALGLAGGEFVALMDHDDRLPEHALYAVAAELAAHPDAVLVYSDEDKLDARGERYGPYFKPDFDPDLLLQQNLVSHLGVFRRDVLMAVGGLREGFEGSQDHDLALRIAAACGPARIRHIPHILYHWRQAAGAESFSQTALDRCARASHRAITEALEQGRQGQAPLPRLEPALPGTSYWRLVWPLPEPAPLVSVIIPTRDGAALLEACVAGLLGRTDYPAIEVLIVDNGSTAPETFALFDRLRGDGRVRILPAPGPFNYSALNNRAAAEARGSVLLLLNNDVEVIGPGWLREMVSQLLRPGVGAVGARLLYADGRLQHGGVVVGQGSVAGHYLPLAERDATGHVGSLILVREVSAATAACLAVRREAFAAVGGLDEAALPVAFNDIDLCLRLGEAGWRLLWTPFAELYHHESATRGEDVTLAKARRFAGEIGHMQQRWGARLHRDPFANPNLDFSRPMPVLAASPPRFSPWMG
ncbi:glycosyltransferase family 2 protein [Belnapia rosea]|uniref:glycosyltransferase family 2 protein n=1 Tax=Belnapia rosea TaxID=938405 RepID=UPI00088D3702|nr:glycosyltransferase family 2 protein [Belnapia rosea]SDB29582.1 Glycosyltransferase, GT2 family [Belnapia rosea]